MTVLSKIPVHWFVNTDWESHNQKIVAAIKDKQDSYLPYDPDFNKYLYAGTFVFDLTEGLGYLAYPDSLWDCLFASRFDHKNDDYKSIQAIKIEEYANRGLHPTDILALSKNIAAMFSTGKCFDRHNLTCPFEMLEYNIAPLFEKIPLDTLNKCWQYSVGERYVNQF